MVQREVERVAFPHLDAITLQLDHLVAGIHHHRAVVLGELLAEVVAAQKFHGAAERLGLLKAPLQRLARALQERPHLGVVHAGAVLHVPVAKHVELAVLHACGNPARRVQGTDMRDNRPAGSPGGVLLDHQHIAAVLSQRSSRGQTRQAGAHDHELVLHRFSDLVLGDILRARLPAPPMRLVARVAQLLPFRRGGRRRTARQAGSYRGGTSQTDALQETAA